MGAKHKLGLIEALQVIRRTLVVLAVALSACLSLTSAQIGFSPPRLYWLKGNVDFLVEHKASDVNDYGIAVGDGPALVLIYDPSRRIIVPRIQHQAYLWDTRTGQALNLGVLPGHTSSYATAVSNHNNVDTCIVVGTSGNTRAFSWTRPTGMQPLSNEQIFAISRAWDISARGNAVVGSIPYGYWFYWTPQGYQVFWWYASDALAISPDGNFVAGWHAPSEGNPNNIVFPFVWYPNGWQYLPSPSASGSAIPYGISFNGNAVVGKAFSNSIPDWSAAIYWSRNQQGSWSWQYIPRPSGIPSSAPSIAYDVSGDGRLVVGAFRDQQGNWRAFLWHAGDSSGWKDLNVLYSNLLSPGSRLIEAYAISTNGRYIAGYGYNAQTGHNQAFVLDRGGWWWEPPVYIAE